MLPAVETRESRLTPLTGFVRQMVLGTLIGDGCLAYASSARALFPRLQFTHCLNQEAYCRHKAEVLSSYVRTGPRLEENCGWAGRVWTFGTVTSPVFHELATHFYETLPGQKRRRRLSQEIVQELDWPAFAYLYMDDGCLPPSGQLKISTNSYPEESVRLLAARIEQLGVPAIAETTRSEGKLYWQIRLRTEPTRQFIASVRPYIHSSMLYKTAVRERVAPRQCLNCACEIPGEKRQHGHFVSCHNPECMKAVGRARSAVQTRRKRERRNSTMGSVL